MTPVKRRRLLIGTVALAVFNSTCRKISHSLQRKEYRRDALLSDLSTFPNNAEKVAEKFAQADTPFLLASYSNFFPNYIVRHVCDDDPTARIRNICNELTNQRKYQDNKHRLDVLPAVTAIHCLSVTNDDRKRNLLREIISNALADPRREVREIVIQNLTSAMKPTADSKRRFSFDGQMIDRINQIIDDCRGSDKLLSPASLSVQCLLNARSFTIMSPVVRRKVDEILNRIDCTSGNPIHFRYIRDVISHHKTGFLKPQIGEAYSLPPHRTELLMGLQHKRRKWPTEYCAAEALVQARLIYSIWRTATGEDTSDQQIMNSEQANVALPKTISFLRDMDWQWLLDGSQEKVPEHEIGFRRFLANELPELQKHPWRHGIPVLEPSPQQMALTECVPFWEEESSLKIRKEIDKHHEHRRQIISWLFTAATAGPIGVLTTEYLPGAFSELVRALSWDNGDDLARSDGPNQDSLGSNFIEDAQNESLRASEEADREFGPYLDDLEQEIGPAMIPIGVAKLK